jgi:hypothetical protein
MVLLTQINSVTTALGGMQATYRARSALKELDYRTKRLKSNEVDGDRRNGGIEGDR